MMQQGKIREFCGEVWRQIPNLRLHAPKFSAGELQKEIVLRHSAEFLYGQSDRYGSL